MTPAIRERIEDEIARIAVEIAQLNMSPGNGFKAAALAAQIRTLEWSLSLKDDDNADC